MEKYFKNISGDYIVTVGTGAGEVEITKEEYDNIFTVVRSRPAAEEGYMYKLRTDLTWERVEAPKREVTDREISDKAALDIILGGERR